MLLVLVLLLVLAKLLLLLMGLEHLDLRLDQRLEIQKGLDLDLHLEPECWLRR